MYQLDYERESFIKLNYLVLIFIACQKDYVDSLGIRTRVSKKEIWTNWLPRKWTNYICQMGHRVTNKPEMLFLTVDFDSQGWEDNLLICNKKFPWQFGFNRWHSFSKFKFISIDNTNFYTKFIIHNLKCCF